MKKYLALCIIPFLSACSGDDHRLRMHPPDSFRADPELMQEIFDQQTRLEIVDAKVDLSLTATDMLVQNQVDLTLVENSVPLQTGVRALLPVYKSAPHLLIRDDIDMWNDEQPLRGKEIHVSSGSVTDHRFVELVASRLGLSEADYTIAPTITPGQTDFIVHFGPVDTTNERWFGNPPGNSALVWC